MQFIDHTELLVRSGHGGRGMVSFRCGHHAPKMGADGGDGGHGGSVYLVGANGLNTLSHLRYRQQYFAENGAKGGTNSRTGKSGEDLELRVPLGTIARRFDNNELIGEVLEDGQRLLVAKGGKRGIGNERFLSATHQAPEECTPGGLAEEFVMKLELKLLADIGFAGFPNAGKSTLLSCISAAKPKIANYPFTTLEPQLGVVDVDANDLISPKSYIAADIPGLIEGAAEGRGLGHEFLKHLERTRAIAYIIDPFTQELSFDQQYMTLKDELQRYNPELAAKPAIVVITKMDLAAQCDLDMHEVGEYFKDLEIAVNFVCAATGEGLAELKLAHFDHVTKAKAAAYETEAKDRKRDPLAFRVPTLNEYRFPSTQVTILGNP